MAGREDLTLHEEKKQRDILETQIASLSSVQDEELIRMAAGFDLPNNGVTELYRGYTEQKDQLTRIQNSGMGNSHPDVVALKKTVNQTKNPRPYGGICHKDER